MPIPDAVKMSMQGLTHAAYTFWPDVILFVSGFFIDAGLFEVMRSRRHKLVLLHTESPYQDKEQLGRAQHVDLNLLNDPTNIELFTQHSGPTLYMPHAYRPDLHYPRTAPRDPELASDLSFIGTAFQSRIGFFEAMDFSGVDFLLGGANWDEDLAKDSHLRKYLGHTEGCVDNDQTAEIYRNSLCGINLYRREAEDDHIGEGWAMGPREIEMAACGLFFLREHRGESDELFGDILPTFDSAEECAGLMRYWLAHDEERTERALAARARIRDRTFASNVQAMLDMLADLP